MVQKQNPGEGERDFFTMDDFDFSGKSVLLRVDINSPIDPTTDELLDDTRLRKHLRTIRELKNSKVIILAHQSRPGKKDYTTLAPHAERLATLLGWRVKYVDELFGASALSTIKAMRPGDIVLLENTRFYAEEEALANKDLNVQGYSHIVKKLAPLADFFINDAFAAAHRSQPTLVGFAGVLPMVAGRVLEKEIFKLSQLLRPKRPSIAILGGLKVDDSISVAANMLKKNTMDRILTTGIVANIFLLASGVSLGKKNLDFIVKEVDEHEKSVREAQRLLKEFGDRIMLPVDVVLNNDGKRRGVRVSALPSELLIQDIGVETIAHYIQEVKKAKTIVVNGPAGVFELSEFAVGTEELFKAVAESDAYTVMGGGHTVAVANALGLKNKISHLSTGGGACIDFLAGKPMPVIEALKLSRKRFEEAGMQK
jgi:phosphoglycerate kinase